MINRLNILLQNKSGTPLNISFQGKQKRNFCSVTFLAKAIEYLFSGSSKTEPQIIFNVADIKSYAIKEICNEYIKRGLPKSLLNFSHDIETENIHNIIDGGKLLRMMKVDLKDLDIFE